MWHVNFYRTGGEFASPIIAEATVSRACVVLFHEQQIRSVCVCAWLCVHTLQACARVRVCVRVRVSVSTCSVCYSCYASSQTVSS